MGEKKWEVHPTYPAPVWEKDLINRELEFNVTKHYRIKLTSQSFPEHMKNDKVYVCNNCKTSELFLIEKKNKDLFKCIQCHSLIDTGKS